MAPQSFSFTLTVSVAFSPLSLVAVPLTLTLAVPFSSSFCSSRFRALGFSFAFTVVFWSAASFLVVFLISLPVATRVEARFAVAENLSFFLSSCLFAFRSRVKGGGGVALGGGRGLGGGITVGSAVTT